MYDAGQIYRYDLYSNLCDFAIIRYLYYLSNYIILIILNKVDQRCLFYLLAEIGKHF